MKKLFLLLAACSTLTALHAQIINPKDAVKNAGENRANGDIQSGADNAVNSVDNSIKGLFHKKKKAANAAPATQQAATTSTAAPAPTGGSGFKAYSNYDFVPGTRIIFEDHFADDQDGEFPSHWNLGTGQAALSMIAGQEAFCLTDGNYAHVSPLVKGATYLTDTFTIEFDCYSTGGNGPHFFLYANNADAIASNNNIAEINFADHNGWGGAEVSSTSKAVDLQGSYPADIAGENFPNKWHHCAVAYRHHQLKLYVDQYRILTVPKLNIEPGAFDIEGIGDKNNPIIMTNFRVANGGGMNLVGHKFTDAKIITHGINFDIDKATIKPESMGTLNMIVQVLKDNPDLRFEVDGHTDNSGGVAHNATLSQQRADAVKAQLTTMGVDAARLTTKGFGDTKPISDNGTPEGKANNRRVEFVRL